MGSSILEILALKKEQAREAAETAPEDEEAQHRYQEAADDEQAYQGAVDDTPDAPLPVLDEAGQQELTALFRKISKLVHPDVVEARLAAEATELFMQAKQAKDNNDLAALRELAEYITTGKPFRPRHETLNDAAAMRAESARLRRRVEETLKQTITLKESSGYRAISAREEWDAYFADRREKLLAELSRLKTESHEQRTEAE